jgi:nucleoside-diphosphate-sugar epimerase
MDSDCDHPLNIGTTRMISINELTALIATIANKNIKIKNIAGPIGVNGRSSDNTLILNTLGWEPPDRLEEGLKITYDWIANEINKS